MFQHQHYVTTVGVLGDYQNTAFSAGSCRYASILQTQSTSICDLLQDCRQQRQTVSVLQREVDSLRGDNVKLYEKIKFLQSYPGTVSVV